MPRIMVGLRQAVLLASLVAAGSPLAQEAPQRSDVPAIGQAAPASEARRAASREASRRLPPDSVTQHSLELPGRTLRFTATAGAIALDGPDGQPEAEIAFVAYALAAPETRARPVTFALNGGPGAASAWLHIGALGPWRLPLDGAAASPSAPPTLVPNAETWLDFTDLVLIDPAGTGFSRLARSGSEARGAASASGASERTGGSGAGRTGTPAVWSVTGDVRSLADFIQRWMLKAGRLGSPVVIAGESYGGFRTPRIANLLQTSHGIGVHTMIMISPALDFGALRASRNLPLPFVGRLPSLAAAALEAKGRTPAPEAMAEIEAYARGEYLADLMRGPRDKAAIDRIVARVAALTGLPEAVVRQHEGRIDGSIYMREANRAAGRVASAYDMTVTGHEPDPASSVRRGADPFTAALRAPLTTAMLELYSGRLNWRVDDKYRLSNGEVNSSWQWGTATTPPEAVSNLRSALAIDARATALVVHGYTDVVTPYFLTMLLLDQIPDYGRPGRLRQVTYPGGHMFYSRDGSRARFREDARRAITEATGRE